MRKLRWWLWAFAALLLVPLASRPVSSLLLRSPRVHRSLTARLAAAFGRPVEVGRFEISAWGAPRLAAGPLTVAEDSRFGYEYFLRAERMTATLDWGRLLHGELSIRGVSLSRPSMNLVRSPDGRFNLDAWLAPPPALASPFAKLAPAELFAAPPLPRIEIRDGRVNFKQGLDKLAFALTDVSGFFDPAADGSFLAHFEARPIRAGVALQEAGTLRLSARMGPPDRALAARGGPGVAAQALLGVRPADFSFEWRRASLSDALRLVRTRDSGARGRVAVELHARSEGTLPGTPGASWVPRWFFSGVARLAGVHRWNLPPRSSDPSVNISWDAEWRHTTRRFILARALVEGPASSIRVSGFYQGPEPIVVRGGESRPDQVQPHADRSPVWTSSSSFRVASSGINLADLFAYVRAFRPGVAEDAALEGNAGMDLEIVGLPAVAGWPLRVGRGVLVSDGARFRAPGLAEPIAFGRTVVRLASEKLELQPVAITLRAGPAASLRFSALAKLRRETSPLSPGAWEFEARLASQTARAPELVAAARALGWTGWHVEGEGSLNVSWKGSLFPFTLRAGPARKR